MTRIDSYHLEMHRSNVGFIDLDAMIETTKSNGMHSHQISNPIPGIKSILVDHNNELVKIQGSAKILTDNYLQGISSNTFEPWIERINQMGIIDLNISKVYEDGIFHSLDTTHNVDVGQWGIDKQWGYIQNSILVAAQNPLFNATPYKLKTNKGVAFIGTQKHSKNRLIFYAKHLELNRGANREFFKSCKNPMAVLNQCTNLLRVESNNTSHKDIKQRFGIQSLRVRDILNTKKMPTLDMIHKITMPGRANQLNMLFQEHPQGTPIDKIAMIYGFENIIRDANYHIPTIREFVKMYTTDAMFRWWWSGGKKSTISIRDLIFEVQKKDLGVSNKNNVVMEHIKNSIMNDYTYLKIA
jgi:hypothetical protein